jgi:FF domain
MPEEFRIWKEKVEAIERKKLTALAASQPSGQSNGGVNSALDTTVLTGKQPVPAPATAAKSTRVPATTTITANEYQTKEEASDAFKALLTENKVTVVAKMKEVQELCQLDHRWNALRTAGERKQALAEYQVTVGLVSTSYLLCVL